MRILVFSLCVTLGCSLPSDLDLDRNNPIDPGANATVPRCGNGNVNAGEACDDGNRIDTDGCTNACVLARCSDGIIRTGLSENEQGFEACDDGNASEEDACHNDCTVARCGDAVTRLGLSEADDGYEACDDGNSDNTDACTNACVAAVCGDGFVRLNNEQCDDGNLEDGDECSSQCTLGFCGDGVMGNDEECDSGGADNPLCVDCLLRRCDVDAGCFAQGERQHCLRVPVGDDTFVHACVLASDAMPTAVPGKVGVCIDDEEANENERTSGAGCSADGDCEDRQSCDLSVAWHRCLPESDTDRVNGHFQPCIPGRGHLDGEECQHEGLECRPAVAARWKGFCSAGESSDGWRVSGYLAQIPGRSAAVCYPLACQNLAGDVPLDDVGDACACPELSDFHGNPTQATYAAGGASFEPRMQGVCLWEECNDQTEQGSIEACEHHSTVPGGEAQCQVDEFCAYPADEHWVQPLDLTHPTGLMNFQERCDLACNAPGTACEPIFDGVSPIAQAQCVVCASDEACRYGDLCWERSEVHDGRPYVNYCFKPCFEPEDCETGLDCSEGHCTRPNGYNFDNLDDQFNRPLPVPCGPNNGCRNAGEVCREIASGQPSFCQDKPCRSDWDCPVSQSCGYGLCRADIECEESGCPDGAVCHQNTIGLRFTSSCPGPDDCDGGVCVGESCLTNVDVGSCRLLSFEAHHRGTDHNFNEEVFLQELTLLEPPNGWVVNFSPDPGGLIRMSVETTAGVECRLESGFRTFEPLDRGVRESGEPCERYYVVDPETDYSFRVFNNIAEGEMHRDVRPALISVAFVDADAVTELCGNLNVEDHEGCDTGGNAPGCVDCRCTEPDWGEGDDEIDNLAQGQLTSVLGCHSEREEHILSRRSGQGQSFVYHVQVNGDEDMELEGEVVCSISILRDGRDLEVVANDDVDPLSCSVSFLSEAADTIRFSAHWESDTVTMPIPATVRIGLACVNEAGCDGDSSCWANDSGGSLCVGDI
jgi:cysteine-rich repeat protein